MAGTGVNGGGQVTGAVPLGGGVPLCDWKPIPKRKGSARNIPILVELYTDPLSRNWPLANNRRIQLDTSVPDLRVAGIDFGGRTSAVVVRPGPDFDPKMLYKVTLYDNPDYQSWMLALTLGVYPDLHRYSFGDMADSVLLEQGNPGTIPEDGDYYDVSSYYAKR